jgi:hypothetical protein
MSSSKRRGTVCHFTFKISEAEITGGDPDEARDHTFGWAKLRWENGRWWHVSSSTYRTYRPERDPAPQELIDALSGSTAERRAIAAMEE